MGVILTEPMTGPAIWRGSDLEGDRAWTFTLTSDAVADIESSLTGIRSRGLSLGEIQRDDFPMPSFEGELRTIAAMLERGRGCALLKGLPLDRFTSDEIEMAYWGIGTHLGRAVSQNFQGQLLGHVRDEGASLGDSRARGYQTRASQGLHVDNCDVVGLLCLKTAKSGGVSQIVNSGAVYNELLRRYPWYVGVLYDSFAIDMRGQERPGESPVYHRPIYSYYEGLLSCGVNFTYIRSAQEKTGKPLTRVQIEALELMEHIAIDLCYEMTFDPGDMQFLNNYVILHDRTPFIDHDDPSKKRHLLRLWLTVPNGRQLAPEFRSSYAETLRSYELSPRG